MQTSTFDTPALYGDHHVTEVRRLLFNLPGVQEVYASSAFQVVQVQFDEAQVTHNDLTRVLDEAGYLGQIPTMTEAGVAAQRTDTDGFFRQSGVYETMKKTVAFQQKVPYAGRPLWNCPGLGLVKNMDE